MSIVQLPIGQFNGSRHVEERENTMGNNNDDMDMDMDMDMDIDRKSVV